MLHFFEETFAFFIAHFAFLVLQFCCVKPNTIGEVLKRFHVHFLTVQVKDNSLVLSPSKLCVRFFTIINLVQEFR